MVLFILWAERRPHSIELKKWMILTYKQATLIGLIQCLALFPGTSRSGSTIIGSLFLGVSRKAAAEFPSSGYSCINGCRFTRYV